MKQVARTVRSRFMVLLATKNVTDYCPRSITILPVARRTYAMPMTLYFKRAKNFVQSDDSGTKKFLAQPGPSPQPVPFWVADTPTFKQGIKDLSIVNLTPPEQMPGYKYPVAAPLVTGETEETEPSVKKGDDDDVEQKEVPQAPFGGQPMTPVAPAPKVGSVRAAGGRGGNK